MRRALIGWLVMAMVATANGIVRVLLLEPQLGPRAGGVVAVITGITLIQFVAWLTFRRIEPMSRRRLAVIALVWLALTVAFEFAIGLSVDKKSWSELLANYNLLRGNLWPIVLASVSVAPFFWGRTTSEARPRPIAEASLR